MTKLNVACLVLLSLVWSPVQSVLRGDQSTNDGDLRKLKAVMGGGGGNNMNAPTSPPVTPAPTPAPVTPAPTMCSNDSNATPLPGKKGIGFTLRPEGQSGSWVDNLPKVIALDPYWNYSWGSTRIDAQPTHIEFVPMIWGYYPNSFQDRLDEIQAQIDAGTAFRVLGFNEPDSTKQSNVAVADAIAAWPGFEGLGIPIVSPSPVQPVGPWMTDFMANVTESCLQVDYIGVHWYGGISATGFQSRMQEIYAYYGSLRPLLITEFAPADWNAQTVNDNKYSRAQVLAFMKHVLPWLEAQSWIMGYAWFPFSATNPAGTASALFNEDDTMTALGLYYASVNSTNPSGDQTIQV